MQSSTKLNQTLVVWSNATFTWVPSYPVLSNEQHLESYSRGDWMTPIHTVCSCRLIDPPSIIPSLGALLEFYGANIALSCLSLVIHA
jgi:hypothetical protein